MIPDADDADDTGDARAAALRARCAEAREIDPVTWDRGFAVGYGCVELARDGGPAAIACPHELDTDEEVAWISGYLMGVRARVGEGRFLDGSDPPPSRRC